MVSRTYGIGVLAAGLLLTACGGGSEVVAADTPTAAASTTAPTATVTASPSATVTASPSRSTTKASSSPSATKSTASGAPTLADTIILEPDGLGYVVGESTVRHVPFGSDAAQARTLLTKTLGGSLTRTDLAECGQGARTQYGRKGFSILVDGSRFVGWTDQGASGRRFTTLVGLGVGSSLKQIKKEMPSVTTTDGSLGAEFYDESGFGGILDDKGAKATLVYAGETCFFR